MFSLLFLFLWVSVGAEVEEKISPECKQFLYMGTLPRGLEDQPFKKICQYYNGRSRFFTLFDAYSHIPVYSAYTFKRSDGTKKVDVPWMYEPQAPLPYQCDAQQTLLLSMQKHPQTGTGLTSTMSCFHVSGSRKMLALSSGSREMKPFPPEAMHKSFEDTQAVLDDYSDSVLYERGQLNPDEHQAHPDDKAATYTLTNVVPQVREFNIGPWKLHEHIIRRRLNNYCRGTAYVVTGVTTAGHMIRRQNINRLGIPRYLWSAYCCTNYDHNAPFDERSKFPAFASHGLNDREDNKVQEMTVSQLEEFLKRVTYVDSTFQIFYDNCAPPNGVQY